MAKLRRCLLTLFALSLLAAAGCRTGPLAEWYSYNPFYGAGPEEAEYGLTAAQRRNELRQFARDAASLAVAEQQRAAADLARQMQNEVDPLLRSDIVMALGNLNSETALNALQQAMRDGEEEVRIAAAKAWQKQNGPEAIAALSEMLSSDTSDDVRLAAARSLATFKDPRAAQGLAVALDDNNPALQRRAMESLSQVTGRNDLGYDVVAWREAVEQSPGGLPTGPSNEAGSRTQFASGILPWRRE